MSKQTSEKEKGKIRFIINTSAEYFNASCNSSQDEIVIKEFFENDDITVLAATRNDGKIQFHHRIPTDENCLLFYKIPQVGSSQPDGPVLGLLTLEGGMVKSIYNSVSRVFSSNGLRKAEYGPEISGLLENLHVSLGSTLGVSQTGISSIQDEINFWNKKSANSSTKLDREQAKIFATMLEKINNQIKQIDQNSLNTVEEFLDSAHNNLDEIWRLPYHYPQNRMADLMDVICNQIIATCVENLMVEDVWNLSSYHVNNLMNQVLDITDSWMQLCDSLTRLFWPNYSQHAWIGDPHVPKRGQQFKDRLMEIKNIKSLFKQIATLLNDATIRNMLSKNSPFKGINIFDTTSIGQTKWNKALNQFEYMLQPIDEKIALAIKAQLQNHLSNPRQIIFIFSKYDTLIQRPNVLELLTIEREQFLQSLEILLQDLKKAMSDTNMEPDTGHLSTICNECRWLKIVQVQILEIEKVSHLISGREGFDKINQNIQELKEETETLLRTNFEIWNEQCLTAVKKGELRLREDQPVVQFEKEGRQLMRVTFNPKLVTFCQDVREFENMGYRVPIELRSSASHAAKFMSYARRLQQIATFHNTIGDRMIPCQRPIMLKNAMELSKLVQSESVAWNDEESVKRYVTTLQEAVGKLSTDNNLLVGYHEQAKRTVMKLMNTDLLSQGQIWKDEMRHLRELVATLESQGYTNLDAFKLHWDHQLYKVLEYQYVLGLIDINSKLPDIHIDLAFRQRQLQFRPSEEEIRIKYYSQLKKFIERPLGFRGLSDKSSDLFKVMVNRNRQHFGPLYKRAEELFNKLNEFKNIWLPWIALGCVDIEELCNVHLIKWQDWDKNFKACKHYSQQIAKIQNSEESIDCFIINILPLRTDIEFISRRYWESLANSLRTSVLNDISSIQEFIQSSVQFLQNVPIDEASIAESGKRYEKIRSEMPKISETLEIVKGKDKCLAGWCKERVSVLSSILVEWDKLLPLIENHSAVLQRQIDIMKDHVTMQCVNLKDEIEKFMLRWESTVAELEADEGSISTSPSSLELFKERQENWKLIKEKKNKLFEESGKLNLEISQDILETFEMGEEKIISQSKQWEIYEQFLNELNNILNEEWTVYRRRPYILTEFISKWESSVHASLDLSSSKIRQMVDQYQSILPVLQQLQSDALTERHWIKIFQLLKKEPKSSHNVIVKDVLENPNLLLQYAIDIQNLVRQAGSEQIVRQALNELDQWAITANLKMTTHIDSSRNTVPLIKDYNEILNKIGDNQSLLQSAKNSAAFEAFSDQAEIWETRLNILDNVLTSLNQSQRKWVYLEPVFGAGTLKNEEALFKRIDKDFRYIMREIQNDPRVLSITKINSITTIINSLENQLSRCQNTLISFMTEKRNTFPRFYFLGDDDLLEILGQATKEEIIQKHIRKLFPGINNLRIDKSTDPHAITAIQSAEGDIVNLTPIVKMSNSIEKWLTELVSSIQNTLKVQIIQCNQVQQLTVDVIQRYPMQIICTSRAINYTKQAERAMISMSLPTLLKSLRDEVNSYTTGKNQTKDILLQTKLKGLLLDLVHYITVTEYLIEHNVTNQNDWHWLQQMKFYLNQDSMVYMKMVFAEFQYSYEFLGNPNKLVHTSLTHKCYLTLTQAMHLGLGGNPFGPAGTGKTECVKALGGMLGRLVLVFNCDENVDTEAMGLILTGLARCGAWGCFDEFNRLQEATLSAISMLIQPIQTALKDKNDSVQILEKSIKLNHHCGIFVTLNPAGEEYGGRQQLPGNIQALFRPIVMQQPEPKEICRVMLFVEGFKNADEIGDRIVELFDLTKKMLSAQSHYDWGLRELKTVLMACGKEARQLAKVSNQDEMKIVVQALRSNTMSKLNLADSQRFIMLLSNVFPEIEINSSSTSEILEFVNQSFSILGLYKNPKQIEKTLQLYEQLTKRMGVVIVGPPSSGKTTIISILKQALILMGKTIKTYTINPKSMNRIQLLGKLDPDTRQWNDGVLTTTAVTVNSEPSHINSWIICDGDIDPEWIEALNSVLDDNKLLSLPSGWRIQFGNNVNFIFETHNLSHASPATISRMGIINLSAEDLSADIIIESFLEKEEYSDLLRSYIDEYFKSLITLVMKEHSSSIEVSEISLINSTLQNLSKVQSKEEFYVNFLKSVLGYIPAEKHNKFANICFEKAQIYIPDPLKADLIYYNKIRDAIEIYDANIKMNPEIKLIETAQMKWCLDILRGFLKSGQVPFIITGPSGCGKTILLQHTVTEFSGYQLIIINCSSQLTPNYVLHILKQNCITISGVKGREYKPQQSKIVMFFKNIDLCFMDAWGTRDVIELILQLIQRNGFYADNLEWICTSGLQICASINSESIQKLSPRYLSVNNYLSIKYPSKDDMELIVQNRIETVLMNFKKVPESKTLVNSIIDYFKQIQENFNPEKFSHYHFTPKTVMKLLDGLQNYPEEYFNESMLIEMESLFKNRLASKEDIDEYENIVRDTMRGALFANSKDLYFIPSSGFKGIFTSVSVEEWKEIVQKYITICNAETFFIETPITSEMLSLISTIARLISRSNTHIVSINRAGSSFISSLYVSATLCSARVHIPQGVRNYNISDFYNDLKVAMQSAALEDQTTILLIDHCWISFLPEIMKPIEAILEGSEIIDLFGDDLESVASSLKSVAQLEGYNESLASFFLYRAKKNLRVVMNLDASSNQLQEMFQTYPALYRNAEIIWDHQLSTETMQSLPKLLIELISNENEEISIPRYFVECVSFCEEEAPRRYYQLIIAYYNLFCSFDKELKKRLGKLKMGVEKLSAAHKVVASLKGEASKQEEALAEKRKLANDALEMISFTMKNANNQKSDLLELKKKTQENSENLKVRKKAIEEELSEVEPILKEASAAVGQIKSEALSEIRSLRAPPETIRDILEGVLRLMGIRDTSWNSMKSFLAKRGVKEDIRSLDPSRISPENCEAVERLLQAKSESFETRNAKRASAAAAPLAVWVIASVKYAKVVQSIKPLEREQFQLQRNLNQAENEMKSLMSGLEDVDARVKELSTQLNVYTQEAAVLELKLEEARNTLKSAEVLVDKLSAEYRNWNEQLENIDNTYKTLDAKSFLLSYAINYFTNLTHEKRTSELDELTQHLNVNPFNIANNLITEQDQVIWESMGLIRDGQAIENAALLSKIIDLPFSSCPIPLLIDPSERAFKWLVAYLRSKKQSFEVISQNAAKISYAIELAVRFGKILIIQDCQDIYPPLMQIIFGRIYSKFNKKLLQVGNKLIDFHENFRLILITKLIKPNIGREINDFIAQIPFTTTVTGLTDQLVSKTIMIKKPELEEKRSNLLENEGVLLKQRIDLEDLLLEELSKAQGDVLKNEKLLQTLNEVKESSSRIENSLKESSEIRETLLQEYNQFRNLCKNASNFYIGLNSMYEISVETFTNLYLKSLNNFESNNDEDKIFSHLIKITYQYLCRSTPKSDHLTLGMFICKNAFLNQISPNEWELFVTNFMLGDDNSSSSCPSWIKKELTPKVLSLMANLPEFYKNLQLENEGLWRKYIENERPEIPVSISSFQKVLIAQLFRPDILSLAMGKMVSNMIGIKLGSSMQPTIEQLAEESSQEKLILMITEMGSDPSSEIRSASKRKHGKDMYVEISIGCGLEKVGLNKVQLAAETGKWICVKNVHLVPNWLVEVERELGSLKINETFRLWIICDSSKDFPASLTYRCVKVLLESPDGLKNKIRQLLQKWLPSNEAQKSDAKMMKLHVIMFILNSILQERLKYIPQGWSKKYEFGDSDLRTGLEILKWMDKNLGSLRLDWLILQGLCEHLVYGGRINNTRDLQILIKHLNDFLSEKSMGNRWSPLGVKDVMIPTSNNIQDYFEAVQKIPDIDEPEEFGLSSSSNLARNIALCKNIIRDLRKAYYQQEKTSSMEKRIRPILSLWKKIASNSTVVRTLAEMQEADGRNPWETFVCSELKLAGKLFEEIHTTLIHLHALSKEVNSVISQEKLLITCLAENQVPLNWRKLWSGPKTAIEYLKAVINRGNAAEKRHQKEFRLIFTENIDLSSVFNPEAFFSSLKMTNSIVLHKSSCNLALVSNQQEINGGIVVKIAPLIVDGANFKNNKLKIFNYDMQKENLSPEFYATFTDKHSLKSTSAENIKLPLYTTASRDKFVCNLNVLTDENADAILLSGAALIVPNYSSM